MTEYQEKPTHIVPPSFFFWVPMLILAALLAWWVLVSPTVEPPVRRLLATAKTQIEQGRPDLADGTIRAAATASRHKMPVFDLAGQLYAQSPNLPDIVKKQHDLVLVRTILDMNEKSQLERKLSPEEIAGRFAEQASYAYSLSRRDEALRSAESAWKLFPTDPMTCNLLGYFLADYDRDLPRAESLIKQALAAGDSQLSPAQRAIVRFLAYDTSDAGIVDSLGWVYYRQHRYPEAVRELRRAVDRAPKEGAIRLHLAQAYLAQGKTREAETELRKALVCKDTDGSYAQAYGLLSGLHPQPRPRVR